MVRRLIAFAVVVGAFLILVPTALAQVPSDGDEGGLSNLAMYALIVGFLLPPVLSILIQSTWSEQVKAVVAFLACLIAGAGTAYFQGDLTGRRLVEAGLVVLTTGMATYRNFWKPTGISPKIEKATTIGDGAGG